MQSLFEAAQMDASVPVQLLSDDSVMWLLQPVSGLPFCWYYCSGSGGGGVSGHTQPMFSKLVGIPPLARRLSHRSAVWCRL